MVIPYAFHAVRHPYRPGKWLGQFTGQSIGTRWVKDSASAPVVFDTEAQAVAAANLALIHALNETSSPVAGNVFSVRRAVTGRQRAVLEAEAAFARKKNVSAL